MCFIQKFQKDKDGENMNSNTIVQKKILREEALQKRLLFTDDYIKQASLSIISKLLTLDEYENANTIFCYIDFKNEVKTELLIKDVLEKKKTLCVPLCYKDGQMTARKITSLSDLKPGKYGILEPHEDTKIIQPNEIDLCIVPCVCADKEGYRIGYGGGYYDRFLPMTSCPSILLCYKKLICNNVPKENHDIKASILITD